MKQVLNESKGAYPTANAAAKDDTVQQQNAENIEEGTFSCIKGVLQRTQRARCAGSGAGVAVQTRGAEKFCAGGIGIDPTGKETFHVSIQQQAKI